MSERPPTGTQDSAPSGPGPWTYAACGALGLGAGTYAAAMRSPIAAIVVAWYVAESFLFLAHLFWPPRREGLLQAVLPRVAGTVLALPIAYLLMPGRGERVALACLIVIALEGTYRAIGRQLGWLEPAPSAPAAQAPVEPTRAGRRLLAGRLAAAAVTALLLVATLYAQGLRAVASDVRVYAGAFEPAGLYDMLLDAAGELLVSAARDQGGIARRAVDLLSEQELEAATRLVLPETWTEAMVEEALASTLSWLEEDASSSVPPVFLPVGDVHHHLKLAVSFLFDQVAPRVPTCADGTSRAALCRPDELSVTAFVAVQKPEALAMVDEAFTLLPAEIDLATVVTMSPRTFRGPLASLAQAREAVAAADRALAGLRWASLAAFLLLLLLSARSAREVLHWSGIALLSAGAGAWLLSWSLAASGAGSPSARVLARALPGAGEEAPYLLPLLAAALHAVHARIWPVELATVAIGGGSILAAVALPRKRSRRWQPLAAMRLVVAAAAALSLLWSGYLRAGERAYEHAYAAYREGDVRSALPQYQRLLRAYPVGVRRPFLSRAQRGASVCALATQAADALLEGAYDRAAAVYEALLVGNPPVAVRDTAVQGLLSALQEGAAQLRAEGAYERALDRLRLAGEALGSRVVYEPMAALYLEWGDALLAEGDYVAAAATYDRIRYDVPSARHWRTAEERSAKAYCAWQAALQDAGNEAGAASVCDLFAEALPQMVKVCAGCGR